MTEEVVTQSNAWWVPNDVSVNRPGYPRGEEKLKYHAVTMHGIDMSSTEIRKRLEQEKSIQYLVPESVLGYIREHRLAKT